MKFLFLGCHLDDIEYGCGGLIAKLNRLYADRISIQCFTLSVKNQDAQCQTTITRDYSETLRAFKILGITNSDAIETGDIPGQKFQYYTQDIREILISVRQRFAPDYVFFPARKDIHQDHAVLAQEAFRIFRNQSCIGYEIVRSCYYLEPNLFVELDESDVAKKIAAVMEYKSQLYQSSGYYFSPDVIEGIAITNGARCGKKYAEAYEIYTMQL